jgi:uncharacterized damage-inducible protein DinB
MQKTEWFNRTFPRLEDNGVLPSIIERLSGTPARLDEMTSQLNSDLSILKVDGKWSVKEHIGHLSDLEPLWYGRLEDILAGAPELRVTDLTNQRTTTANHNATEIKALLKLFRQLRQSFVDRLTNLKDDQLTNIALHPRLKTPMRVIDLAYFVAEHDDHHLASIRELFTRLP